MINTSEEKGRSALNHALLQYYDPSQLIENRMVIVPPNPLEMKKTAHAGGRTASNLWHFFTLEEEPWRKKEAVCKHCNETVRYHKKSEYAGVHLRRCHFFRTYCEM